MELIIRILAFSFSCSDEKSRVGNTSRYLILCLKNSFILTHFTVSIRIWLKCPEFLELIHIFLSTRNASFFLNFVLFSIDTLILNQKSAASFKTWIILLI